MPMIGSDELRLFVIVTVCGLLMVPTRCEEKLRLAGEKVMGKSSPLPVKVTVCGLSGALSLILTTSLYTPGWVGWKETITVQLLFGCNFGGQPLLSENGEPPTLIFEIVSDEPPVLMIEKVYPAPPCPIGTEPKLIFVGLTVTMGGVAPTPVNGAVTIALAPSVATDNIPEKLPIAVGVNVT
jgi:hypothetical protein